MCTCQVADDEDSILATSPASLPHRARTLDEERPSAAAIAVKAAIAAAARQEQQRKLAEVAGRLRGEGRAAHRG